MSDGGSTCSWVCCRQRLVQLAAGPPTSQEPGSCLSFHQKGKNRSLCFVGHQATLPREPGTMSYRDFGELALLFCYISLPWVAVARIPGPRHLGASEQHILLHLGSFLLLILCLWTKLCMATFPQDEYFPSSLVGLWCRETSGRPREGKRQVIPGTRQQMF